MIMFSQGDDGNMILEEDLVHEVWTGAGIHVVITVPKGFHTDGASIPRPLLSILGPPIRGRHFESAIVHDYLCVMAASKSERSFGDAVFFKLLRDAGVPKWKRIAMYFGVGVFGRYFWKPPVRK